MFLCLNDQIDYSKYDATNYCPYISNLLQSDYFSSGINVTGRRGRRSPLNVLFLNTGLESQHKSNFTIKGFPD